VVRICSCTKAPAAEVDVEAEAEEVVDEQIHSTGEGSGNNEEELSALFYSLHDSLHIPRADELQRLVELREETRCSGTKARRATELMAQSDGGEEVAAEEEEADVTCKHDEHTDACVECGLLGGCKCCRASGGDGDRGGRGRADATAKI
jgi:hypothetical protein